MKEGSFLYIVNTTEIHVQKNCLMIIHVSRFIETENNPTFSLPSNQAKHSSRRGKALVRRAEKASSETTLPSGGHRWNCRAVSGDKQGNTKQEQTALVSMTRNCFKLPIDGDLNIEIVTLTPLRTLKLVH